MGICALHLFVKVAKRFESPKALHKFPLIIVIINFISATSCWSAGVVVAECFSVLLLSCRSH